jgi:hypothetical protein
VNGTSFGARWWPSGQATWLSGGVKLSPPTRASPPRVDVWQPRLRPNGLKPWSAGQGIVQAVQPLCLLGLGSGPLGPCVEYTPVVMVILTFGQLHFVIF